MLLRRFSCFYVCPPNWSLKVFMPFFILLRRHVIKNSFFFWFLVIEALVMLVLFNSNSWLCTTAAAAMTHCSANKLQASRPKIFPPSQASATLYCRCLHTCVETVKSLKKWKANKKDDFFGCCEVQNRFVLRRFIVVDFMGMRFREFFEVPNFSYVSKLLLERLERNLFGESL